MEKTLGQIAYEAYSNEQLGPGVFDKWEQLSEPDKARWEAAGTATCLVGGNYITNDAEHPTEVTFCNGRKVTMENNYDCGFGEASLVIE